MKEYLKMADVFIGEYKPKRRIDARPPSKHGETHVDISGKPAEYAVHAINSHDELVENMQHYKQDAEQWEARATKEASRAQDLEGEVERLRDVIESVISTSEALALKTPTSDWGDGFKECALTTANALKNIIDSQHK